MSVVTIFDVYHYIINTSGFVLMYMQVWYWLTKTRSVMNQPIPPVFLALTGGEIWALPSWIPTLSGRKNHGSATSERLPWKTWTRPPWKPQTQKGQRRIVFVVGCAGMLFEFTDAKM